MFETAVVKIFYIPTSITLVETNSIFLLIHTKLFVN